MSDYVLANSLRQAILPHEILGRANAMFHVAARVLLRLGALIAGPIATAAGSAPHSGSAPSSGWLRR